MNVPDQDLKTFLEASREAANRGGQILRKWLGKITVQEKGARDLVTQADFESQMVIRNFLLKEFPDHAFIGEENLDSPPAQSSPSQPTPEFCWIVDPLDGTTNYVHQLRSFAVSVGLYHQKQALVGTVLDPLLEECFCAARDKGATLNGVPIQTSRGEQLEKSLVVFSFRRGTCRDDIDVVRFLNVLEKAGSVRRLGSAALNLCYVACGRTDAYWATSLAKWDVAAGWLIATEAGAKLADFSGAELDLDQPHFCVAASPELFNQIKPLLNI